MGYVEGIELDDMGIERLEIAFWVFIRTRNLPWQTDRRSVLFI